MKLGASELREPANICLCCRLLKNVQMQGT